MLAHVDGVVHRDGAWGHTETKSEQKHGRRTNMEVRFFFFVKIYLFRRTNELTDLFRDERSASVATKIASISSEAVPSEAPAVEASVSITIGHVGELEAIVETVAVVVGEMAVGVAAGEPMSLRDTHNAQPPELL